MANGVIKLIGVGTVSAKSAEDLVIGDKTIWTYGDTAIVKEIIKETEKTITLNIGGEIRRFNKKRLIGFLEEKKGIKEETEVAKSKFAETYETKKIDKSQIMKRAWEIARKGQKKFGGKVREYFSAALKEAWAEAK